MLIWQGWGILPVLYAVAAVVVAVWLESLGLPQSSFAIVACCVLLLAAVATWFTGVALNRIALSVGSAPGRRAVVRSWMSWW